MNKQPQKTVSEAWDDFYNEFLKALKIDVFVCWLAKKIER